MRLPGYKQVWYWGGAGVVLLLALWGLGNTVLPFLLGAGIAYLLDPVADWLERRGLSRTWSVVIISLGVVVLFAAAVLFLLPLLIRQTTQLIDTLPQMIQQLQAFLTNRYPGLLPEGGSVRSALSEISSVVGEKGPALLGTVLGSVASVVSVLALLVIVPVVAFYLLLDWDHMVARVDELLPREHAPTIRRLARDIDSTLSGFVRGQGTVIMILGTFYSLALFAVGLPFGLAIGAMAALLSFIPYFGVLVGGATAIGVALFHFWGQPVWIGSVVAIFAIGQIAEGNYLQPKIVGGHVGLHPVWLLLALSVFGTLFGFPGLLVAVPLAAALGVLVRFAAERYKESALYTGRELPPQPSPPLLVEIVPSGTTADTRAEAEIAQGSVLAELRQQEARKLAALRAQEAAQGNHGKADPAP